MEDSWPWLLENMTSTYPTNAFLSFACLPGYRKTAVGFNIESAALTDVEEDLVHMYMVAR
jgi:hypothetical protein